MAWTLITAEVPYTAASVGIFPRKFMRLNARRMPAFGLFVSSVVMQVFLLLVVAADDAYMAALNITGMMVLPAYLASGLFLMKIAKGKWRFVGFGCSLFCLWTLWAAGLDLLLDASLFYLAGFGIYGWARRQQSPHKPMLTQWEVLALAAMIVLGIFACVG